MLEVVGLTARGWEELPPRLRALVQNADVLLGGPRHLSLVPERDGQRWVVWPVPLRERLPALLAGMADARVVALASGDPLVAGIGSTLIDLLGADQVRIHPAVSSVALARARMGWAEETTSVLRLRGADLDAVRRRLVPQARLLILSRDGDSPAEIAHLLSEAGYGGSVMTVFSDLGADSETRRHTIARDWSGPAPALNLVAVRCVSDPDVGVDATASLAPGLPDTAYDHDGQLTKRDVRASALARLMPRPGELLWDVGAGAGSVAIEWLRADSACRAVAVERDPGRADRIAANARRLGVSALRVVHGEAPAALEGLPAPDAVFVGGGGSRATLAHAWSALTSGGRMVAHAVTQETEAELVDCWRRHGGELTRLSIEHLEPIGRFHGWQPARAVVQWSALKESALKEAALKESALK